MSSVLILPSDFRAAASLGQLLALRRITLSAPDARAEAVVLSARHEATLGGMRAVTELARRAGASKVFVVAEDSANFLMVTDLGGRLVRLALPAPSALAPLMRQVDLLMLADTVGAAISPMAAGDPATGALIDLARRVARSDVSVFINGPTGTGKEVLSRFVHDASPRAARPFVAINCAAIPETMLEATLFGHEKGAFTGASAASRGLIRAADGGTLLLDEISEMPLALQAKLLRVLQERRVTPVGGQAEVDADFRVIATSNRDMAAEVRAGRFRQDLYYRLNVFPLKTLPLAERRGDIAVLAAALLRRHGPAGTAMPRLSAEALSVLERHSWPGNVRELENVIQRALVLGDGSSIEAQDILLDAGAEIQISQLRQAI